MHISYLPPFLLPHERTERLTRQGKQDQEINHQHRPEDRHVEDAEPRAEKTDGDGPRGRMPELEFGESSDEGSELFVFLGGEASAGVAVLEAFVLGEGGVDFGLEECEEEVEEIDA